MRNTHKKKQVFNFSALKNNNNNKALTANFFFLLFINLKITIFLKNKLIL